MIDESDFLRTLQDDAPVEQPARHNIQPFLVVLHGESRGKRIPLTQSVTTLGRSTEADIVIEDGRISRVHCSLRASGGQLWLSDLNSRNGTYLDGQPVDSECPLSPQSTFRIGRTVLKVSYKSDVELKIEEELFQAAILDPLTGVANRRWLEEQARVLVPYSHRHELGISALILDVDHFKTINDSHGHAAGDAVLVELAALLRKHKREADLLCRYGGEEFVLLMPGCGDDGREAAERLRLAVESHAFRFHEQTIPVTISIGVSSVRTDESWGQALTRADEALYVAKESGRNAVRVM